MNLLVTPTYFKSLFNKANLFFPAFLLVSSTIIINAEISGIFTKSLKNTSTLAFFLTCLTCSLKKVGSLNSSSFLGKGMQISFLNLSGGSGLIELRYSAASLKAGSPLVKAILIFFSKKSPALVGLFLSLILKMYCIESLIISA